jgi:hypothetical protein
MAQKSGIETPTAEDLPRVDRKWKGKTPPNADWKNRPIRKRRVYVKRLARQTSLSDRRLGATDPNGAATTQPRTAKSVARLLLTKPINPNQN